MLMEYSWRGITMARAMSDKARLVLSRSSKTVREEAGRAVVLVLRCLARFGRMGQKPMLESPSFLSEWFCQDLSEVYQIYTTSLPAEGSKERLALKNRIEGCLYVFCHGLRLGHITSVASLLKAGFPVMLALQEDADREFAQVSCVAVSSCHSSLPFCFALLEPGGLPCVTRLLRPHLEHLCARPRRSSLLKSCNPGRKGSA